jgi:hydroxymethylglutaryl-CoA lyase
MADTDRLYEKIQLNQLKLGSARTWCLVPNLQGLERAHRVGASRRIAIFISATETFNQKNIGMSIRESLHQAARMMQEARALGGAGVEVRGYISTAFGCPFEGKVSALQALRVIHQLEKLGVDQISIGDTIGVANPLQVAAVVQPALKSLGVLRTAVHFHDTRGTALANVLRAIDLGVRVVDSSAGGLGGCPFAPGASGNLATEDLVYMLNGMGMQSGIHLERLCQASLNIHKTLKRPMSSRYLQAFAANCSSKAH